jgi:transposase
MVLRAVEVEQLIPADHPARLFWEITGQLNLKSFYASIKSVEGRAGREAIDPRLLISIWLYAYRRGIGSAREISRMCETDPALQWLTGMGWINAHTLGDFRVDHKKALDELFTQVLGMLLQEGLITLERVTQDGTKLRAAARQNRFRREERIREHLAIAREHVEAMGDPQREPVSQQQRKAMARVARERVAKLENALEEIKKLRAAKQQDKKTYEPRVSETDPEVRVMKTGEGGFVPCYNAQLTTDAANGLIVGAVVVNDVNDHAQLEPAMERLKTNLHRQPEQVVADGDFTTNLSVVAMEDRHIDFYGSWPKPGESGRTAAATPEFQREHFIYDAGQDHYTCPAGQLLALRTKSHHANQTTQLVYRADTKSCRACAHHDQCCPPNWSKGRTLTRKEEVPAVTRFQSKMATGRAKQIYRTRSQVAEFPHAWIKSKFGLARLHLRGLVKAETELLWAALTYNLTHYFRLKAQAQAAA